jgi:hypothetical protein
MDLLRLDSTILERIVPTNPTPGLERHEPGGGKSARRRVERRDPEDLDQDADEDSSEEETEKHTFDTRA